MTARMAEIIAKIENDIGVDKVLIRPVSGDWAIIHPVTSYSAETLYRGTKEECEEILSRCR